MRPRRRYTVGLDELSDKQLMAELADNFTGIGYGIIEDKDQLCDAATQAFQDTTEEVCKAYNFDRDAYQDDTNGVDVFDSVEEEFRQFAYRYIEGKGVKFDDDITPSPMLEQIMKTTAAQQRQQAAYSVSTQHKNIAAIKPAL